MGEMIDQFKEECRNKFTYNVGFIGCGNMAKAIVEGLVRSKIFAGSEIIISGTRKQSFERWEHLKVATTLSNVEVIESSRITFLCVKPNILGQVAKSIEDGEHKHSFSLKHFGDQTLVSILAGISIETIRDAFPSLRGISVIRAMPNTPLLVCAGATAITKLDKDLPSSKLNYNVIEKIFATLGLVETVEESKFHAVTGLSGSGPAYVYIMIESLSDAGVKQGLPRDLATKFAAQTLFGASKTILDTGILPAQAKEQVTSAGGTTIHGIHELEKGRIRDTLMNAVEAATKRSIEMSKH